MISELDPLSSKFLLLLPMQSVDHLLLKASIKIGSTIGNWQSQTRKRIFELQAIQIKEREANLRDRCQHSQRVMQCHCLRDLFHLHPYYTLPTITTQKEHKPLALRQFLFQN